VLPPGESQVSAASLLLHCIVVPSKTMQNNLLHF